MEQKIKRHLIGRNILAEKYLYLHNLTQNLYKTKQQRMLKYSIHRIQNMTIYTSCVIQSSTTSHTNFNYFNPSFPCDESPQLKKVATQHVQQVSGAQVLAL